MGEILLILFFSISCSNLKGLVCQCDHKTEVLEEEVKNGPVNTGRCLNGMHFRDPYPLDYGHSSLVL